MSGGSKAHGTTSLLLQVVQSASQRDRASVKAVLENIRTFHRELAEAALSPGEAVSDFARTLTSLMEELESLVDAAMVLGEMSRRSVDVVISYGERISAALLAAICRDRGIPSQAVDLFDVLRKQPPHQLGDGQQAPRGEEELCAGLDAHFYSEASGLMADAVRPVLARGLVPIVTGFFGPVPGSLLGCIGRGYSDLSAALLAVGLAAGSLTIWKEVCGVFSADPAKVPLARLLPTISPEEAAELTYYGSEVIHPLTMHQVMRAAIPIRIRDVRSPSATGTTICMSPSRNSPRGSAIDAGGEVGGGLQEATGVSEERPLMRPSAVTIKEGIIVLNVTSSGLQQPQQFFSTTFAILNRHHIVVDLIATSRVSISLAVSEGQLPGCDGKGSRLGTLLGELSSIGTVGVTRSLSIVSLVGLEMRHMIGISARLFGVLAAAQVNIEMISQGASEINISCVVASDHAKRALVAIHDSILA